MTLRSTPWRATPLAPGKLALRYAGVTWQRTRVKAELSPTAVKREIRRLCREEYNLASRHIRRRNRNLYQAARRHFGTWRNALRSAGVDPRYTAAHPRLTREQVIAALAATSRTRPFPETNRRLPGESRICPGHQECFRHLGQGPGSLERPNRTTDTQHRCRRGNPAGDCRCCNSVSARENRSPANAVSRDDHQAGHRSTALLRQLANRARRRRSNVAPRRAPCALLTHFRHVVAHGGTCGARPRSWPTDTDAAIRRDTGPRGRTRGDTGSFTARRSDSESRAPYSLYRVNHHAPQQVDTREGHRRNSAASSAGPCRSRVCGRTRNTCTLRPRDTWAVGKRPYGCRLASDPNLADQGRDNSCSAGTTRPRRPMSRSLATARHCSVLRRLTAIRRLASRADRRGDSTAGTEVDEAADHRSDTVAVPKRHVTGADRQGGSFASYGYLQSLWQFLPSCDGSRCARPSPAALVA